MISLLYSGNEKVFDGMLISLISITNHCSEPLDVHLVTMDWTEINKDYIALNNEHAEFIEEYIKKANKDSKVTLHNLREMFFDEFSSSPNADSFYTPYTLLRLFLDKIEGMPQKLLYLDTDTVAMKDISELYNIDVSNHNFAAAKDYLGKFFINPRYMNAGVMLFNLKNIKENGFLIEARELCKVKKYAFPDQDVINHCEKNKLFLPRKYNEQKKLHNDTVIRHFSKTIRWFPFFHTLNIKPWDEDGIHNIYKTHAYDDVLSQYHSVMRMWKERVKV